jgi:Mg2+ and Co2+ transporter CorA
MGVPLGAVVRFIVTVVSEVIELIEDDLELLSDDVNSVEIEDTIRSLYELVLLFVR